MLIFLFPNDCPARHPGYTEIWANPTAYVQEKYGPPLHRLMRVTVC